MPFQSGFSVACSEARGAVTSTVRTGGRAANYQASLRASLQQKNDAHTRHSQARWVLGGLGFRALECEGFETPFITRLTRNPQPRMDSCCGCSQTRPGTGAFEVRFGKESGASRFALKGSFKALLGFL